MEIELKLSIIERVVLPMFFLPQKFNLDDGLVKRDIREKIELTTAEKEKINFKILDNGFQAWGGFLKCKKCGTVFKDPYKEVEREKFECDSCSGKEYEKFEQFTDLTKVFKFSKPEIFFLDKQVTRLHDKKEVEDRILDLCLRIRELMKEIPKGLEKPEMTTVKKRK